MRPARASTCINGLETLTLLLEHAESARDEACALVSLAAEDVDRSCLSDAACTLASAMVGMSLLFALRNLLTINLTPFVVSAAPATPVHAVVSAGPSTGAVLCSPPGAYKHTRIRGESENNPASSLTDRSKRGLPTQWCSRVEALVKLTRSSCASFSVRENVCDLRATSCV